METYIVRQPVLDKNQKVAAYEILYKEDESSLYNQRDSRVANAIEQFLTDLNSDKFLGDKAAFLTFTPNLLMKNIPKMFSEKRLVIQIEDNTIVHPVAQRIIYRYKKQGYRIAIKGFEFSPRYFGIMDAVDIVKVDFSSPTSSMKNIVSIAKSFSKEVAAYNIGGAESFELAKELGCDYFQGAYVAEQKTSKIHRMDHMQSNFFQLMIAVTKDEPDIEEIAKIISRDVTLAFSLMKLVNSAYFALRNRAKSVHQALVILGLGQLKQWIYLLSFKRDNGGAADELIKTSFLRGNFCMELSKHVPDLTVSPSEAYLMGMFSTLGTLMEVPLESALEELALSDEIKAALLTGEGRCGLLYQMVLCYEKADWSGMTRHAEKLGIPMNIITQIYFECVEYVNSIWKDLMMPVDGAAEEVKNAEEKL